MRSLFSTRRGALLYLCVCGALGLSLGAVIATTTGAGWSNALLFALPAMLVYGLAAGFSAYYLCRAYPLGDQHPGLITVVMSAAALCCGLLWSALLQLWNGLLLSLDVGWAGIVMTASLGLLILGLGVVLYGLAVAVHYLLIEFLRSKAAEQRQLESQLMAQQAELRMLRTQVDPHFLFNSLNSISALTAFNPAGAREMTLRLADFFRHGLGMDVHKKITLEEELVLIRHFLAIEQVRFGSRLRVEEVIDAAALGCLLPPMLIQPLVENAVKHGISHLTEGGLIRIAAHRQGSQLHVRVENTVDVDLAPPRGLGIGLSNVRQRLAGAYRHAASVHWQRQPDGFSVDIVMPLESSATTREDGQACE